MNKDVQSQINEIAEDAEQLAEVKKLAHMVAEFYHDLRDAKISKKDAIYLTSEFVQASMDTCEGHVAYE